jgi:hypothetical protein
MRVERVEPGRVLAMRSFDGTWVWIFALVQEGDRTRFLSRNRFPIPRGYLQRWANTYLMEPGSLVMERKMLLGIKARAERLARQAGEGAEATPQARVAVPA